MKKKKKSFWTKQKLLALGIPMVMIPGILLAVRLGWNPVNFSNEALLPATGTVLTVEDGDTLTLTDGQTVRLLGVNAPDRGAKGFDEAKKFLTRKLSRTTLYFEYDRYQDDKYGRILAWVWIDCEEKPTFLLANYMHLSGNASRPGVTENPEGCKEGELVNEELVRSGNAVVQGYDDRGPLKYEQRIRE